MQSVISFLVGKRKVSPFETRVTIYFLYTVYMETISYIYLYNIASHVAVEKYHLKIV